MRWLNKIGLSLSEAKDILVKHPLGVNNCEIEYRGLKVCVENRGTWRCARDEWKPCAGAIVRCCVVEWTIDRINITSYKRSTERAISKYMLEWELILLLGKTIRCMGTVDEILQIYLLSELEMLYSVDEIGQLLWCIIIPRSQVVKLCTASPKKEVRRQISSHSCIHPMAALPGYLTQWVNPNTGVPIDPNIKDATPTSMGSLLWCFSGEQ